MDVFTAFSQTSYTFLVLNEGGVLGNTIRSQYQASGIFKERSGMVQTNDLETVQSDATMHIKPNEGFLSVIDRNCVGHGVRATKNGSTQDYRVIGQVEGFNFDTNVLEFYKLTLKAESLAEFSDAS